MIDQVGVERTDVQGNILNGYTFEHATYLLASAAADGLRAILATVARGLTTAARKPVGPTLNVAITYSGFVRLGLPADVLARFPVAFSSATRDRAALLGDVGASAPDNWLDHLGTGEVQLLLTVHAATAQACAAAAADARAIVERNDGRVLHSRDAHKLANQAEHFGFADGFAQPDIEGVERPSARSGPGGGRPLPDGGWAPLKLGEFLLGYPDEEGTTVRDPDPELVRNGSYLVYRELEQDVPAFEAGLLAAAQAWGVSPEYVAAKVVGRWRDGTPVEVEPQRAGGPPDLRDHVNGTASNTFRYAADPAGNRCPVGAHIRRANPRDAQTFDGHVLDGGRLSARHRIIRRGMPYGEPYRNGESGHVDRGLVFVCYNADIERQFELIQGTWCADASVVRPDAEGDYVLGTRGGAAEPGVRRKVTIPVDGGPPRFVPLLPDVVVVRGSEYAFAPGLTALRALAEGYLGAPGT